MVKKLTYILTGAAIFLSSLTISPNFSYGKNNYIGRTQKAIGEIRENLKKKYRNNNNNNETGKNIAKDILEYGVGIPGVGKIIDGIDNLNKREGFYKKQKETNKRLRSQGRYPLPKWAR